MKKNVCNSCGSSEYKLFYSEGGHDLVKCKNCSLVYLKTQPTEDELKEIYSFKKGYHNQFADNQELIEDYERRGKAKLEIVKKHIKSGNVLDVGCSAGFFLKAAKDEGFNTFGVELSPDTAKIARERYGLNVVTSTLENAGFENDFFDLVTFFDVLEHVPDPTAILKEANRITKKNGLVIVGLPNVDGLFPRISLFLYPITGYWWHHEMPIHLFQFTKRTLNKILAKTGYEKKEIIDTQLPINNSYIEEQMREKMKNKVMSYLYFRIAIRISKYAVPLKMGDLIIFVARKK
ncbi:MAG: Ubiquinone biosynthesis O-methyltransferase [Bacteroidia bacterium]|nr:Ubiquinone biosynthesis O-methyltransferase [Bacteroidia bacterium]